MTAGDAYRSVSKLAAWVATLFAAQAAVAAGAALLNAYQLGLLSVFRYGGTVPEALVEAQDVRQRVVTGFEFGFELAALILFLVWVYRFSRNTWRLRPDGLEYTPGWSVGWFFVPVAGLVVPYNVFHELWRANRHDALDDWRRAKASRLLAVWWTTCVASAVIHYSPLQVLQGRAKMAELLRPYANDLLLGHLWELYWGRLLADLVCFAASVLAVALVLRLTGMQNRLHAAIGEPQARCEDAV